jgi:cytochrome c-type biogenesis protein CcmH/NrfG
VTSQASRVCPDCGAPNALDATSCLECNHPLVPMAVREEGPEEGALPTLPHPPVRPLGRASPLPGSPSIAEEPGKVIPRRRHARAALFGLGAGDRPEVPGGAPSWIWLMIGALALGIAAWTAIHIASQTPAIDVEGASREQLVRADSLARVLRRDPNDRDANVELGNVYYDTKNFADAVNYYRRALAIDSTLVDVAVDMAVSLHQSGHTPEAIATLKEIIARHPEHVVARFDLGVIYEFQGRLDDADAVYREALALPLRPELRHAFEQRRLEVQRKRSLGPAAPGGSP